jgi:hypothetical protein
METTILHSYFPSTYQVSIRSFNNCGSRYAAILDVWQTEEYRSITQYLVFIKGIEVVGRYLLPTEVKWNCMHELEEDRFLLGSHAKKEQEAFLAVFDKGKVTFVREFYKGFSTNILKFDSTIDGYILITGEFYEVVQAGSHDDYWPQPWTQKISTDFEDASGEDVTWQNRIVVDYHSDPNSKTGDYFYADKHLVKKYNSNDKLIWEQDVSNIGEEKLFLITYIATYYKLHGEDLKTDGIWAAGRRMYAEGERGTGFSTPILFRLTSGGTIVNYTSIFKPYPDLQKVSCVVSDTNNNCFILGETLVTGKGNGLFLMHFDLSQSKVRSVKYFNYVPQTFDLAINDHFVFCEIYHDIKYISPVFDEDKGDHSFILFANVSDYIKKMRDVGMAYKIRCLTEVTAA